ncbi:MAG: tetratricopeptide repeat protein [Granulosicoccus sp.]|nr:tetratricopeptide repeat protein [Granulosicoccus sp.]
MSTTTPIAINKAIEDVLQHDRGRLIAGLVSRLGDLQVAEDALQDASISAMSHWGRSGLPNSPTGWLMKVALNKGIDKARAVQRDRKKTDQLMTISASHFETIDEEPIPDDRLRLIFTCCHPLLEEKSRIGLTLRTVCHLTTREIAAAFLDREQTMGQRLSRAKEKLREADIEFEIPDQTSWPARLDSVLSTIYLIFTTGYVMEDDTERDLCAEAIFLLRLLDRLRPDDPEIEGALALVLLTDARSIARIGNDGATVPPAEQNRNLWDMHKVEEAREILSQAILRGRPGPYQIKAAIADCHMMGDVPDWKQISLLYGSLWAHEPTPVVALNWATVIAELGQPKLALSKVEALENDLKSFQPFYAAYAGILSQLGQLDRAKRAYKKAIELSQSSASRIFLEKKLQKLG